MALSKTLVSFIILLAFCNSWSGLPAKIEKMVVKEIEKVFETDSFTLEAIPAANIFNEELPLSITSESFYKIKKGEGIIGYFFVDKAPSKTAEFDYLVIFTPELIVKHSRVLIYREEYGGEIGSRRWLKQFIGLSGKDRVNYGENIDGISGATISVRSMTNAMDNLLRTVEILHQKEFFK